MEREEESQFYDGLVKTLGPDDQDLANIEQDPNTLRNFAGSLETTDLLGLYFQDVDQVSDRLLTAEEEFSLAKAHQAGELALTELLQADMFFSDEAKSDLEREVCQGNRARQRLIEANLKLAVSFVLKQPNSKIPVLDQLDSIQELNIGLDNAVRRFDPTKGFRFSTYAYWWFRQANSAALQKHSRIIRLPAREIQAVSRLVQAANQHNINLSHLESGNRKVLVEETGYSADRIDDLIRSSRIVISLDQETKDSEGEPRNLQDSIADPAPGVEETLVRRESGQEILKILRSALTPREWLVICLRNDGDESLTLDKIGQKIGVSRERVRQIQAKAEEKLSSPQIASALSPYL